MVVSTDTSYLQHFLYMCYNTDGCSYKTVVMNSSFHAVTHTVQQVYTIFKFPI